jgi:hypothetical protein
MKLFVFNVRAGSQVPKTSRGSGAVKPGSSSSSSDVPSESGVLASKSVQAAGEQEFVLVGKAETVDPLVEQAEAAAQKEDDDSWLELTTPDRKKRTKKEIATQVRKLLFISLE